MLQDYSMQNNRTGTHSLWRIIFHMCHDPILRSRLVHLGAFKYLSFALDSASSQHYVHQILRTIKLLVDTNSIPVRQGAPQNATLIGKLGPKIVDNFLDLLATSRDDNLLLIIELLGYTGLEESEGVHVPQAKKIIQKILEIGIASSNTIKFAILTVVEKMFSQRTSVIANRMNSERILLLIMAGLNHGSSKIKETASKLTLRMVITENIDLSNEPDLLGMVLLNCKLHEDEFFELRRISIEIIFRMSVSVAYAKLIILNASQVLEMTKIALSILHPEISNGANQTTFLLFDSVRLDEAKDEEAVQVKDEETMHFLGKLQGFRDRVIQEMSQNRDTHKKPVEEPTPPEDDKKPQTKKGKKPAEKNKPQATKNLADDSDDSDFEEEKANINAGLVLGEDDLRVVGMIKNLVKFYDQINDRNPMRKIDPKGCDIYTSTYFLIKIATILLSCDITYLKVMSLSLHAVCGIIMDKAIGAREMIVVDSIITFYSALFDIIYFRMDCSMSDALENLIQIISARFVIKMLKIIKKELDSHVTNEVILSSAINLIIRLLMKEETAQILTKFKNLGPVLEKIIEKGLEWKSPNILMMASILGTHLSIYPEFQEYLFNREFIAYLMGLLEPSNSEYIQAWGADGQNKSDAVMAGESLLLTESIMANTEIIIQLTSLMLNNLCHQSQLSKILGSLPVKYGVKPLVQIFLIDRTKVSKLIQCLCLDTDFQSKMISFVPVDFAVSQKAQDEARNAEKGGKGPGGFFGENMRRDKDKKDKKKEEEQKNAYEAIKELIHDPKTMKVVKGREYHVKIARIVFNSNKPNSLLWRRLIKMSIIALKDDSQSSILWMGRLLRPLTVKIQHDNVVFEDIQQIDFDPAKREDFYYKPADLDPKIYPDDSLSATMKKYKMYPTPKRVPQLPPDASLGPKMKKLDYEIEDGYDRATDLLHPMRQAATLGEAFANPTADDPKKLISIKAKDELKQQALPAPK